MHLIANTVVISYSAQIANAIITDAKITNLNAGKIDAGYLSVDRLDASIAYITNTLMLSDLVVTTAKCAELLGIRSHEIPVIDPKAHGMSYSTVAPDIGWSPWTTLHEFRFNAYPQIKHNLEKVVVEAIRDATLNGEIKIDYSLDSGATWISYGLVETVSLATWTEFTFIYSVTTALSQSFWPRIQGRVPSEGATEGISIRYFELRERAFLGQRMDI